MPIATGMERVFWLNQTSNGRSNNLNLIRFLAASAVILSHCWVMRGLNDPVQQYVGAYSLGDVAVRCFLFLSGYLILQSGTRSSDVGQYLAARVLRIFPALALAILACVFIVGPIATTLSTGAYFAHPQTWTFLREIVLYRTNDPLPGVFTQPNQPHEVNSVLWTLPVEWTMYMVVLVACLCFRGRGFLARHTGKSLLVVFAAFAITAQMMPIEHGAHARSWVSYFVLGSITYLLRKWIPLYVPAAMAAMAILIVLLGHPGLAAGLGNRITPVVFGYFLLTVGFHPALLFQPFLRLGDYSYGLYIFAFPIQQLLMDRAPASPWLFFALTYPPALLVAILSWHFVEKPCLAIRDRLKRRQPQPAAILEPV